MDENDFFVEQVAQNGYRVSSTDLIVTVFFETEKDPDEAVRILADFFNSYGLLEKERKANARLTVAFGIVFNDLSERLGLTPEILFDDQGVQDGDTSA